jgi:hypothetical protein
MKFRGITTSELEDEIRRRRNNPTKEEADLQKKVEKERQISAWLDRLHREEPKNSDNYNMWEIKAEDENCDMGGSHHQERLAVVRGSYRKACEYAVKLKGFAGWGYGGNVVPIKQEDFIDLGD